MAIIFPDDLAYEDDEPWYDNKEEELRDKWPNLAKLEEEYVHAEECLRHQSLYVAQLKEERDILRKLYGVTDDKT